MKITHNNLPEPYNQWANNIVANCQSLDRIYKELADLNISWSIVYITTNYVQLVSTEDNSTLFQVEQF